MKALICALLLCVVTQYANAGAIADQKKWDKINDSVKKSTDSVATEKYCGNPISVTIDKDTFKGEEAMKTANWCGSVVDGIGTFCYENPKIKPQIVKAVKTVKCVYDPSLKGNDTPSHWGTKFNLNGTTLEAYWNKGSANLAKEAKAYLAEKL